MSITWARPRTTRSFLWRRWPASWRRRRRRGSRRSHPLLTGSHPGLDPGSMTSWIAVKPVLSLSKRPAMTTHTLFRQLQFSASPRGGRGRSRLNKVFRSRHFRSLVNGGLLLLLIHVVGTFGYRYLGRPTASWIDSFYMTFITVATIGYAEVVDLSAHPMGRLFTVAIAVVGIATMSYLFSTFVALLLESDLNAALRKRHMERQIAALRGHYIVCGVGRVGSNVADELVKTRRPFVVLENDQAALDRWLERCPQSLYLHDDAADDDALRRAGVLAAAGTFAVTGDDSHNLMIAL